MEEHQCKVPLLGGDQALLSIGDPVYCTKRLVSTRCGFGVLGEVLNPIGEYMLASELDSDALAIERMFKTS